MSNANTNTNPSQAHKEAAKNHQTCADHHLKAAALHENHKDADAKTSAKNAKESCEKASKNSAAACAESNN